MKTLYEYTKEEIARFDMMHKTLADYNRQVQKREIQPLENPPFSPDEIMEYSRYRELLMAQILRTC